MEESYSCFGAHMLLFFPRTPQKESVLIMPQSAPEVRSRISLQERLLAHIRIARLDHSLKNIFVLPGIVIPLSILRVIPEHFFSHLLWGLVSTTLIACSNYVINEYLDAPSDRKHPIKKTRPAAQGLISAPLAYSQWLAMMAAGIYLALKVSNLFALAAAALWVMGCLYNIRPIRTKDVVYLDVITESINNPLRLLLGWYMVTDTLIPPVSLLVAYWMFGCYLMALKRFSELREIGDPGVAGSYRKSFRYYTAQSLLRSVLFYASLAMLLFGAFIIRYRIELILSFPFISWMMSTYFDLSFKPQSPVQNPEKLYREKPLMFQLGFTVVSFIFLLFYDMPWLSAIFTPTLPSHP